MPNFLKTWEGGLAVIFLLTLAFNAVYADHFLTLQNQINLFNLSIEKIMVALAMTLIILNAEIDLSVASVMGLSAAVFAYLVNNGWSGGTAVLVCLAVGVLAGMINATLIARVGIPSLVVTLAMMIGFRGFARVLLEDKGMGNFPDWFVALGRDGFIGPFPLAFILFIVLLIVLSVVLHRTGFGRRVYVIGNNAEVARYSGVKVTEIWHDVFALMVSPHAVPAPLASLPSAKPAVVAPDGVIVRSEKLIPLPVLLCTK